MNAKPALIQALLNGDVEITVRGPSGVGKEAVLSVIESFILANGDPGVRFRRENRLGRDHNEHRLLVGHCEYASRWREVANPSVTAVSKEVLMRSAVLSAITVQVMGIGDHHHEELFDLNKALSVRFFGAGFDVDRNALNFTIRNSTQDAAKTEGPLRHWRFDAWITVGAGYRIIMCIDRSSGGSVQIGEYGQPGTEYANFESAAMAAREQAEALGLEYRP